jgi:DNA-dependent RNA polymerase auxiliary subunit epsilon
MTQELTTTKKRDITADELRDLLHYDPETGGFTWLVANSNRAKAGARAGGFKPDGYRHIRINGKLHYEHRLVWLHVHGAMPTKFIDHIDGDPSNNRLENLREATNAQNNANKRKHRDNTSGRKGVSWHAGGKKWHARISVNNKAIHIGYFDKLEDAAVAYQAAALKYQGDFAFKGPNG